MPGYRLTCRVVNVAAEIAALAGFPAAAQLAVLAGQIISAWLTFLVYIHSDVDYHSAGLNHISGEEFRPAYGADEDVRGAADRR
jgi:hypothetical protein